jgi:hypothetical protein
MTNTEVSADPIESGKILPRLNAYLRLRYALKADPARTAALNANVIEARRAAFDLYLRVGKAQTDLPDGSLVIARIGFRKTRQGNGRSLIRFLTDVGRDLEYKFLAMESPNANCRAFAACMGFYVDKDSGSLLLSIN